jgi:hypothetical protein
LQSDFLYATTVAVPQGHARACALLTLRRSGVCDIQVVTLGNQRWRDVSTYCILNLGNLRAGQCYASADAAKGDALIQRIREGRFDDCLSACVVRNAAVGLEQLDSVLHQVSIQPNLEAEGVKPLEVTCNGAISPVTGVVVIRRVRAVEVVAVGNQRIVIC